MYGGNVPFFKPTDLNAGYFLTQSTDTLTEQGAAESRLLPKDSVLVTCIGATIGKTALARVAGATNQQINAVVPNGAALAEWLYWWFISRDGQSTIIDNASATTLPIINKGRFAELDALVAPLNEQRRIVSKIEALTARSRRAKEALDAVPALLDKLRQSILASAFRGDLTADWRAKHPDVEPASVLLERIRAERRRRWEEATLAKLTASGKPPKTDAWKEKYQEPEPVDTDGLPELPEGWAWASVEETTSDVTVGHVGSTQSEYRDSGIPFLRSQNVRANRFSREGLKYVSRKFHSQLSKSRLAPGDVVVVRSGEPGTSCVIPDDLPEANCADVLVVRPLPGLEPAVLAHYFNAATRQGLVKKHQVGMAQQHFNVAAIRKFTIPLMPLEEARAVQTLMQGALDRLGNTERIRGTMVSKLGSLDSTILAKAFRGELVSQDPNDEPASVLLERIRAERESPDAKPKQKSATKKRNAS